jgi:hypothetical protein
MRSSTSRKRGSRNSVVSGRALSALLGITFHLHVLDWVGLGTLFLGLSTFVVAFLTWRTLVAAKQDRALAQEAVDAAHKQAEVAQKSLDAQIQPLIMDVPLDRSQGRRRALVGRLSHRHYCRRDSGLRRRLGTVLDSVPQRRVRDRPGAGRMD